MSTNMTQSSWSKVKSKTRWSVLWSKEREGQSGRDRASADYFLFYFKFILSLHTTHPPSAVKTTVSRVLFLDLSHPSTRVMIEYHYIDVIMTTIASQSPAWRLFTQSFIQAQIKENIKAPRHWPLYGEVTGTGSNAENVSIWWRHHVRKLQIVTFPIWNPNVGFYQIEMWTRQWWLP